MRICKIVDFAVPADHRINLKENEKRDKYLDLAREIKKLRNMKVTIVPKGCFCILPFNFSYLPTPPLGQNMTQGQFLSGV